MWCGPWHQPLPLEYALKLARITQLFSLGLTFICLTACPQKRSSEHVEAEYSQIVTKGDPNQLIKGALTDSHSPISESNINEWNQYRLITIADFVENEKVDLTPASQADLEKENVTKTTTTDSTTEQLFKISVGKIDDTTWTLTFRNGQNSIHLKKLEDGQLQVFEVEAYGRVLPVQPIHWSISHDRRFISLLVSAEDQVDGRSLTAIYFEKPSSVVATTPMTDSKYIYSAGPGRKIGWKPTADEAIDLNLCGSKSKTESVKADVAAWTKVLSNRLTVNYSQTDRYYPFSDLNQHCIYVTDIYMYEPRQDVAVYGITSSIRSLSYVKTIDSDIFLFSREFQKQQRSFESQGNLSQSSIHDKMNSIFHIALVHELGHWFGLGHKFNGPRSIMSYDLNDPHLQPYDIEAVHELYPLR